MPSSLFAFTPAADMDEILDDLRRFEAFKSRSDEITLQPLHGNSRRRDHLTRPTFIVSQSGKVFCHLTVGRDLASLWNRTESFHQACPTITGKPLFYEKGRQRDYLAREFIDGKTVEHLVSTRALTAERACQQAAEIQRRLDATLANSEAASARAEAGDVFEQLQRLPFLSVIDKAVFRDVLAPLVYSGIETMPPRTRWTNGDFTPRNLLVDSAGNVRLIDYEFAAQSHFFTEDRWRWRTFSALPTLPETPAIGSSGDLPPWMEIFFWAKQLVLSHETILPEFASIDSRHAIGQIVGLARVAGAPIASSLFLQALEPDTELRAEVERLKIDRHELSDKVARMHASHSWRYTAWLRAIRRWLHR